MCGRIAIHIRDTYFYNIFTVDLLNKVISILFSAKYIYSYLTQLIKFSKLTFSTPITYQVQCWENSNKINEIISLVQQNRKERLLWNMHLTDSAHTHPCCTSPTVFSFKAVGKQLSEKGSHCPHVGAKKELRHTYYYASSSSRGLLFSDVSWESIIMCFLTICLDRSAFQTFLDGSFALTILCLPLVRSHTVLLLILQLPLQPTY
jgi:hypothetical protein